MAMSYFNWGLCILLRYSGRKSVTALLTVLRDVEAAFFPLKNKDEILQKVSSCSLYGNQIVAQEIIETVEEDNLEIADFKREKLDCTHFKANFLSSL